MKLVRNELVQMFHATHSAKTSALSGNPWFREWISDARRILRKQVESFDQARGFTDKDREKIASVRAKNDEALVDFLRKEDAEANAELIKRIEESKPYMNSEVDVRLPRLKNENIPDAMDAAHVDVLRPLIKFTESSEITYE